MGSIEYILTNIAGINQETLARLRGKTFPLPFIGDLTASLIKNETGPHLMKLIDAILNLDGASSKNLGSAKLAESNPGSIESFFELSSKKEEPKAN